MISQQSELFFQYSVMQKLMTKSDDPNDDRFLIGQMGGDFVGEIVETEPFNPKKCWRRVGELTRHEWNRWMKEYLHCTTDWIKTEMAIR